MTTSARPVLVVDDEPLILRSLRASLLAAGYHVTTAVDGLSALEAAALRHPAAVVLDLRLPDIDGVEVCRRLREWTDVPVIVVSALDSEIEKIAALDAGADDYVTKPYSAGELLARLRAALRRVSESVEGAEVVQFGAVVVDLARQQVLRNGTLVHLTPTEYELVATFARDPGKVLTHAMLLRSVWGLAYQGETHYVRVYMARLRRKLEEDPSRPRHLVTQSGIGYRLVTDDLLAPPKTASPAATSRAPERDIVDEVGEGSFPSSDPPSWSQAVAS